MMYMFVINLHLICSCYNSNFLGHCSSSDDCQEDKVNVLEWFYFIDDFEIMIFQCTENSMNTSIEFDDHLQNLS